MDLRILNWDVGIHGASKVWFLLEKIIYFDRFKIFLYIFLYLIFLYFLKINKIF
jgi:hypothetical protein